MANGYWGGKLPIINLLLSQSIFLAMRWRLFFLRIKNRIRATSKSQPDFYPNKKIASDSLQKFIDHGYDKLNIGGGTKNLSGFVNIDFIAHPGAHREVVANILDLGFIPTHYASQIHSNHVIEHFSEVELLAQLKEYRRILKDNGTLTIRCPNALGVAYGFWFDPVLEHSREAFIQHGFPEDEDFSNPHDKWGHKDLYAFIHWIYGDMGNIVNQHMNVITPTKLKGYMASSGFEISMMSDPEALNLVVVATKL